jgi:hypothetical protein
MASRISQKSRIGGEIELAEDMDVSRKLYDAMPWLKEVGNGTPDCPTIFVFKTASGQYTFWAWKNVKPGPWIP